MHPAIKTFPALNVNTQKHLGVLGTAELRTLAQIDACLIRVNPHAVRMIGNQIRFSGQARHPKAMVDIIRKQR